MSNRTRRKRVQPRYQLVGACEPYPEHAKLADHIETNWAIKDFLSHLADRGIFLSRVQSGKVVHVTESQIEACILGFRGVDIPAYQAESQNLIVKYGANMPDVLAGVRPKETDPDYASMIRIISLLDSLGVPAWAGRPTCRDALREANVNQPETGLFARAVKLRKSMYGVVSSVNVMSVQQELPLQAPAPEPELPVDAAMMLREFMNRPKEDADVQAS